MLHASALDQFDRYRAQIAGLPQSRSLQRDDLMTPEFRVHAEGDLEIYYAPVGAPPFDGVRVVIVGITPGWTQMELAFRTAVARLAESGEASPTAILRACRSVASFAGSMRTNLISMLDDLAVHTHLGLGSSAELFQPGCTLLHTTSAIRLPVFVRGRNYTGHSPSPMDDATLRDFVLNVLARELDAVPDALVVPLGMSVQTCLEGLIQLKSLAPDRCLMGFPHPSGANGHRARQFSQNREVLSRRVDAWLAV